MQKKKICQLWKQMQPSSQGVMPYRVWQYLQGQNVEALVTYRDKYLRDLKLASAPDEVPPQVAFAVRNANGELINILQLKLEGLLLLANVGKTYTLLDKTSVAGCAVHFGEPVDELGIAIGVESAMAISIATGGIPCWASLGPTGMRTLKLPTQAKLVTIFSDIDPAGRMEEAAKDLAQRLGAEGRSVDVRFPPCAALGVTGAVRWHDAWMEAGSQMLHI